MKKKNNLTKELKLKKTIIMNLTQQQMNAIVGGGVIKLTQPQTQGPTPTQPDPDPNTNRTSSANDCGTVTVSGNH